MTVIDQEECAGQAVDEDVGLGGDDRGREAFRPSLQAEAVEQVDAEKRNIGSGSGRCDDSVALFRGTGDGR